MISGEERRLGLGASEIAAAAGLHPRLSRADLMARKLGLVPEPEQTWMMFFGKSVEGVILDTMEHRPELLVPTPDWRATRVLGELPTLRHAAHPWAFATIDGMLDLEDGRKVLIEIKTSPAKKIHGWGDSGTPDVPTHYAAQVLFATSIALSQGRQVDESWIVAMFGTREPQIFPVPYDAGRAEWLLGQGQEFMDELEAKRREEAA